MVAKLAWVDDDGDLWELWFTDSTGRLPQCVELTVKTKSQPGGELRFVCGSFGVSAEESLSSLIESNGSCRIVFERMAESYEEV